MDSGSRGLSCCHLHTMKTIAFAKHKPRAHRQLTLPVLAAVLEQSGDLPGCTDQLFTPSSSWLLGCCGCGGEASGGWMQLGM